MDHFLSPRWHALVPHIEPRLQKWWRDFEVSQGNCISDIEFHSRDGTRVLRIKANFQKRVVAITNIELPEDYQSCGMFTSLGRYLHHVTRYSIVLTSCYNERLIQSTGRGQARHWRSAGHMGDDVFFEP